MASARHRRRAPGDPSPPEIITSRDNRWLKKFRAALRGPGPPEDGWVAVEGPRLVEEALRAALPLEAVLLSAAGERHLERLAPLLDPSVRLLSVSDRLFTSVSDTKTPQGVAALVRLRPATLDAILGGGAALITVLVGVQDPGNVGTVVRAAEAFGGSGVVAAAGSASPFSPKALRASAGSALRLPILHGISPPVLLAQLRVSGVKTYATTLSGGQEPAAADLRAPVAVLIGSEGAGLPPEIVRSADGQIHIPLAPAAESLNAAVAASVLLYEAARQRQRAAS